MRVTLASSARTHTEWAGMFARIRCLLVDIKERGGGDSKTFWIPLLAALDVYQNLHGRYFTCLLVFDVLEYNKLKLGTGRKLNFKF